MGETGQDDDWLSVKLMKKKVSKATIFLQSKHILKCLHLVYDISRGTYSYVKQGFPIASLCRCSVSEN